MSTIQPLTLYKLSRTTSKQDDDDIKPTGSSNSSSSNSLTMETDTKSVPALEQRNRRGSTRLESNDDQGESKDGTISVEEEKAVLKKIDRVLIPLMMAAYTFQYIDKSSLSYAALYTLRKDAHLSAKQYSSLGTLYYAGYLALEIPGSFLFTKLPLNRYLGCLMIIWGALLISMAGPKSFAGLGTLRFFLGATESIVTPGFILMISRFYKREEQPLRVGIWYSCNGLGSVIGGLISYGMGHIPSVSHFPNWAWIFLLNGFLTLILASLFLWLMPNFPETAWFLNSKEKLIAKNRLKGNKMSLFEKKWKWEQVWEGLIPWRDPQGWLLSIIVFLCCIPNGGIGNFLHLILKSFGYTPFQTILIGLPAGALQVVCPLTGSYIARKVPGSRLYVMMVLVVPAFVGCSLMYATNASGPRLFGYYICVSFVGTLSQTFAMPAANVAGYTKKIVIGTMMFIAYSVGNLIGPQLFDANESPPYHTGELTCIVCFSLTIPVCLILRLWYIRENTRRDKMLVNKGQSRGDQSGTFADVTDVNNMYFRYVL